MDAASIYRCLRDPQVARWLTRIPRPYRMDNAHEWVAATRAMADAGTDYHFGIESNGAGEIIGMIGLHKVNLADRNAELGYWLGRAYWGRGLMREAVQLIFPFAFSRLGLHRIYAIVAAPNEPSWRLLESQGFVREGTYRGAHKHGNRWCDVYSYGILRAEWKAASGTRT